MSLSRTVFFSVFNFLVIAIAVGFLYGAPVQDAGRCDNWSCVGICSGPGSCVGEGCVCVGYTRGAGRCVSE
jgi:hypothetical protein